MSKLEDLLEEHTDEACYEMLVKTTDDAESYVNRVFEGNSTMNNSVRQGAELVLHYLRTKAEGINPHPSKFADEE